MSENYEFPLEEAMRNMQRLRQRVEAHMYKTAEEARSRDNLFTAALLAVVHDDQEEWKGVLSVMSDEDLHELLHVAERLLATGRVWQGVRARQAAGDAKAE